MQSSSGENTHTAAGRRLLAHELAHVVQHAGGTARARGGADRQGTGLSPTRSPVLQRYAHSDCTDADLRAVVWPADGRMKDLLAKAIRVLTSSPTDPVVQGVLAKHFQSSTPAIASILANYNLIQADVTGNAYTYECEDDCEATDAAYVRHRLRYIGISPNIHLCLQVMRGYTLDCNASLILHEFAHYSAHTDDKSGCYVSCSIAGCAATFSAADALDNSSSYANFALELWPLSV